MKKSNDPKGFYIGQKYILYFDFCFSIDFNFFLTFRFLDFFSTYNIFREKLKKRLIKSKGRK